MRVHKKTNPTGGKGKGKGGRKNFIDEIISKVKTSLRLSSRKLRTQYSLQTNYETEEVVGHERVEETAENTKEPIKDIEEPIEDIEGSVEDIEELVQDIEGPTKNIKDQASATGEQPMEGNNEGLFGGG